MEKPNLINRVSLGGYHPPPHEPLKIVERTSFCDNFALMLSTGHSNSQSFQFMLLGVISYNGLQYAVLADPPWIADDRPVPLQMVLKVENSSTLSVVDTQELEALKLNPAWLNPNLFNYQTVISVFGKFEEVVIP